MRIHLASFDTLRFQIQPMLQSWIHIGSIFYIKTQCITLDPDPETSQIRIQYGSSSVTLVESWAVGHVATIVSDPHSSNPEPDPTRGLLFITDSSYTVFWPE